MPHIDYPFTGSGDGLQLNREIMQNCINEFGGQAEKVRAYRDNLLKLKGLTIDIGKNDTYRWIVQGGRHFAKLLQEAGIPHELVQRDGGPEGRLRERVENHLLPFFSKKLADE